MVIRDTNATVLEVAKAMTDWNISSVAITDDKGENVVGILTERDIVRNTAKNVLSGRVTAGSLMSTPVVSVKSDMPIEDAARLMLNKKVRHLIVEDAKRVVGIITTTDLARYLKKRASSAKGTPASPVESPDPLLSEVWELYF
jgi:CBS domain-containing protein